MEGSLTPAAADGAAAVPLASHLVAPLPSRYLESSSPPSLPEHADENADDAPAAAASSLAGRSAVPGSEDPTHAAPLGALQRLIQGGPPEEATLHSYSYDELVTLLLDATPLPVELIDLVTAYRVHFRSTGPLLASPMIGSRHSDSVDFDTLHGRSDASSTSSFPLLPLLRSGRYCIREVIAWEGDFCHGVQFRYGPAHPCVEDQLGAFFALPEARTPAEVAAAEVHQPGEFLSTNGYGRHSWHEAYSYQRLSPRKRLTRLGEDEVIVRCVMYAGDVVDRLVLHTNLDRAIAIGSSTGGHHRVVSAPTGHALVGIIGRLGGHAHALSFVFAPFTRDHATAASAASPRPLGGAAVDDNIH